MKKVLMLLSNSFNPDPRVYKEAKSLIKNGFDVTIFCLNRDDFKKYEKINGINIIRFDVGKVKNGDFFNVFFKLLKFYKISFLYLQKNNLKFDIIHANDWDTLFLASKIKKKLKIPLIYDSHELFYGYTPNKFINLVLSIFEKSNIQHVDALIHANEYRLKLFKKKFSFNKKSIVLENFPQLESDFNKEKNKKIVFQYQGGISLGRNLESIILAINSFSENERKKFDVYFFGQKNAYSEYLENLCCSLKLSNVFFKGYLKYLVLVEETKKTSVGFVSLKLTHLNNIYPSPNKIFDYIANKNVVLAQDTYYIRDIVKKDDIGFLCNFSKPKSIYLAMKKVLELKDLNKKQEKVYKKHIDKYNWEQQEHKLIKLYEELLK